MRLQLGVAAALAASLIAPAAAAPPTPTMRVTSQVGAFDDGSVQVVAPRVDGSLDAGARGVFSASAAVDLVSGATRRLKSDLISGATRFREQRQDGVLGWRSAAGEREVGVALAAGSERDFRSIAVRGEASVELWQRRARLQGAIAGSAESLWLPGALPSWRPQSSLAAELHLSHILHRRWVVALAGRGVLHRCDERVGCQASPYRFVSLRFGDGGRAAIVERHPGRRARAAGELRLSFTPARGVGLHAGADADADDWGVRGGGAVAAVAVDLLREALQLRLEGRATLHSAAQFFRRVDDVGVDGAPAFRTGDRRLGGMRVLLLGLQAALRLPLPPRIGAWTVSAQLARQATDYHGFDDALGRRAWLLSAGLGVAR